MYASCCSVWRHDQTKPYWNVSGMSLYAAPAPESSKQGAIRSFSGAHGEHQTRDAEGVEFDAPRVETPKASRSWGMGRGIPLPTRLGGLGERRKLPPAGSGAQLWRKTILGYRVRTPPLQRLLKINVVHIRPLVGKNGFTQWIGSDPLRQPRQLRR